MSFASSKTPHVRLTILVFLTVIAGCNGGNDSKSAPLSVAFFDANGSKNADGTIDRPFTIQQAAASGKEILVALAGDGPIQASSITLSAHQQLLGGGDTGAVFAVSENGQTRTFNNLGNRPILLDQVTGTVIILSGSNTISGLELASTVQDENVPVITGINPHDAEMLVLHDLKIKSFFDGIKLDNPRNLNLEALDIESKRYGLVVSDNHGETHIKNIKLSTSQTGGVSISNSIGTLEISNIQLHGGTEGGLSVSALEGNVTISDINVDAGGTAVNVSGEQGAIFVLRKINVNKSFEGLHVYSLADYDIQDISLIDTQTGISTTAVGGNVLINDVVIKNISISGGGAGFDMDNNLSGANFRLKNLEISGDRSNGIRINNNGGIVALNNVKIKNVYQAAATISGNSGRIDISDSAISDAGVGIFFFVDSSVDAIRLSDVTIQRIGFYGAYFEYCTGQYMFNNVTITQTGQDPIKMEPNVVLTIN